ncbi:MULTISPECIES: hypothetical protein [Spiroplasma]|uniref:hypothetical protein n=1 Tax=Spiroplasma TaxID=2132 RepID=UPI0018DDB711|nr:MULTISPECIES: hypothetical protein [Spiroplasma]MBH8622656.1 hypothetical protein [Spiroplasma sp. hyd1]UNF62470.1 hypothetical protein MNU24_03145 [Spiroplasma poulsonii]
MNNFNPSKEEQKSWKFNLLIIQNLLLDSKLPDDVLIVFEWIQKNQTRIDITLLGVDKNSKRNIMTIEIKNWSARSTAWNIYWEKDQNCNRNPHPYHKAEKQYLAINELLRQRGLDSIINLKSCAYLPLYDYPRKHQRPFNKNDELIFNAEIINKLNKNEGIYQDIKLILQNNRNALIDKIQTMFENGQGKMVVKLLVD